MTFIEAIRTCYSKYAVFAGRATRSEYWYFVLFGAIVSIAYQVVFSSFLTGNQMGMIAGGVVMFFLFTLPTIAVSVRRLHDIGRSGWWLLIVLVPLIGWILVIYWHCMKSTGDNIYGSGPTNGSALL